VSTVQEKERREYQAAKTASADASIPPSVAAVVENWVQAVDYTDSIG